jgi:carbon monoxide dehydrogenase subunit G
MEITGAHTVASARPAVWAVLNDAEVLRRSLPGCESVVCDAPGEFEVVVAMQVGPLKARFNGSRAFTEQDPPPRA